MHLGGASRFFGGPLSPASAPTLAYGVCDNDLTGLAGLGVVARLARFLGLPEKLAASVRLQRRRCGGSDGQLLALLYAACAGGGAPPRGRRLGADAVARRACGLRAVSASRRLGEYLQRMHAAAREGLRECARLVSRRLVPLVAQACGQRWGYVPVFVDGTGIEVEGKLFENAERGYNGEKQSWLHAVCVGVAWVSARLHAGGTDVRGDGREQLDQDVAPWLTGRQPVGLRADSAYPCKDLASSCRRKGWEDSGSVTAPRQKAPILRLAAARGLREDEGESLDAAGKERAIVGAYRPARWPEEPVCGVIRRDWDGEQQWLVPVCTVILVSRDWLPLAELGRRHRGRQGQEQAFQGPLTDLLMFSVSNCPKRLRKPLILLVGCLQLLLAKLVGLQHPPCRSHTVQQGFYLGGQIAQLLLLQYPVLPAAARQHGLRPLIRYCVGSVGRLTRSARRLLFSRSNLWVDWLLHAASRMEPG